MQLKIIILEIIFSTFSAMANSTLHNSSDESLLLWYDNDITKKEGITLAENQLIGTIKSYGSGAMTVSFHLNITDIELGWGSILHIGNSNSQRQPAFWLRPNETELHSAYGSTTNTWELFTDTPPLIANRWHHIVMIDEGDEAKLYVNNKLLQTIDASLSPTSSPGNKNVWAGNPWYTPAKASIDDIRIYNRAVTLKELSETPTKVLEPSSLTIFSLGII